MLERAPNPPVPSRDAPRAEQRPSVSQWHGVTLTDEFAWLKAANWQEVMRDPSTLDPAIRAYLEAENAYAESAMAGTTDLQAKLFAEMKARIEEDESTVPSADGPYAYYVRHREGGQHPIICRQPRDGGDEQILLDGDVLAAGKAYFRLDGTHHSPDHRLLVWSSDEAGSEYFTIRVRDLATGADLPDTIPDGGGDVVWLQGGTAFLYIKLDANHRPSRVYRHRLGTPVESDVLVYEEAEAQFFVSLSALQSRRYAEISIHDHETAESRLIDLTVPEAVPFVVAPRETSVRYQVEHHPDLFGGPALVISTNADGAEDFKIAWTPLATPERAHWHDLVPHRPGVFVMGMALLRDWLVRIEREDGLPRIVIRGLRSGAEHDIAFAEEAYSLGMDAGLEFATDRLRFTYSSMTTPSEVWDYDMATRDRTFRKRQKVPSGHDPNDYVTRRLFAPTKDGETVPISLLHRKGLVPDGTAPCLLYGYGAYGMSMPAAFGTSRLSLVDRGFVYAIAHVRGGTEKGWRWYREGKLARKTNTFDDFVAAAEFLTKAGWAAADRIVAQGGSAGGLLMGAVANRAPQLFGGIIAEVPFVDALNTMLDDSLPLTPPEWPEWGNPAADPQAFTVIRAYSPYDNVAAQPYPAILVLAGLTDPRVTYWEPAKWVARLRTLKTDRNLLVLRTNMEAGHGGAAGRFDRLKEVALAYAFALKVAGSAQA